VYNNALNSFDVTISDASYVSVVGAAGQTGIPLRYMHRQVNADGSLKLHVDIDSTAINGSLPVSLTLLSSQPGQPTCITIVSFPVAGLSQPAPVVKIPAVQTVSHEAPTSIATSAPGMSSSSTVASSALPVVGGGLQSVLSGLCTAAGPYQLWFILLALFMVGIGLIAFAEPPLTRKSAELPAAAILVPLVLLLLFWYVTPDCRVAVWIPVVLLVAAAVALIAAYREKEMVGGIFRTSVSKPLAQPSTAKPTTLMKQTQTTIVTPTKTQQTTTTITPNRVEQTKTIITPPPKKQ
jgi:hypothetical protein